MSGDITASRDVCWTARIGVCRLLAKAALRLNIDYIHKY
jgi:hypothetical protein